MNNNSSTNLTQYVPEVKELFRKFMNKDLSENQLVEALNRLERRARRELVPKRTSKENLWFRFFEGDTLATSIPNIRATIMGEQGKSNMLHMYDCMDEAVNTNPKVYFS
jgi:hypothetical protein